MSSPDQGAKKQEVKKQDIKQRVNRRALSSLPACDWAIDQLPGLSQDQVTQLETIHICTIRQLLHQGNTLEQRQAIAAQLQIHIQHVNKWVALANLARIPSVGCQYCGLILHAGVSSPAQLAQASIAHLHRQILKLQVAMMQRPDLCPGMEQVAQWIEQAKLIA